MSKSSERTYVKSLEAALKAEDGLDEPLIDLRMAPVPHTASTIALMQSILLNHVDEARQDMTLFNPVAESRAVHRVLVEGPYSVKSSGGIELTTFEGFESGQARINLVEQSALISAKQLCSLNSGDAVVELKPSTVNAYAGRNGTVNLGVGIRNATSPSGSITISSGHLRAQVGTVTPSSIYMSGGDLRIAVGPPDSCRIIMEDNSIVLKCGTSSLKIDATGITLTGNLIRLVGQSGIQHSAPLTEVR